MDNICITGGNGFIGSHLARALPGAKLFDYPEDDLRNIQDARDFINRYRPETVYHLAAQSVVTNETQLESESINIQGTYNLLNACLANPNLKSFVHISTDKVYGTNANARRTDELRGVSHPYSASKICGDVISQMYKNYYGLPIRIVRMANIYGPGDPHLDRIVPGIITDTLAGIRREHRGDPRWIRDFIFVGDLIPALIRISTEPTGIYNLGGDYCTLQYIAELIPHLMGRDDLKPIWTGTQHNEIPFQHIVDCPDWWNPETSLVEGLLKTIASYSERI
jgi:nucleoside-diphosphate-sugar epimerase